MRRSPSGTGSPSRTRNRRAPLFDPIRSPFSEALRSEPNANLPLLGDRDGPGPGDVPRAVAALGLDLDLHLADLVRRVRVEVDDPEVVAVVLRAPLLVRALRQER